MSVISVKNLYKKFGSLTAVDGVSFNVEKGEIFALLGPNGAGKTTTLEILEGLQEKTAGEVSILGFDIQKQLLEIKKRIGIQLQASAFYEYLNLKELLDLFASFYNQKVNALELLQSVGLEAKIKSFVTQLSGGQKQRFSIIAALVNNPEIVFLDEPTTGLDPQARRNLWQIIDNIRVQGKTVILTTHYMDEAQVLANRIAIMDNGKIIDEGTAKELIAKLPYPFKIIIRSQKEVILDKKDERITIIHQEFDKEKQTHEFSFGVKDVGQTLPFILEKLKEQEISFNDLEVVPGSLEDVFLALTGKELRD